MKRSDVVIGQRYRMKPRYEDELAEGTVVEAWRLERAVGIQVMRVADIEANPEDVTVYKVAAADLEPIPA